MAKTKAQPASGATGDTNGAVLVLGATGALGQHLVQQLRQAQRPVRAYIRDTNKAVDLEVRGANVQIGRLMDQDKLAVALQGTSGVLWAVGARPNMMPADIDMTEFRALLNVVMVIKAMSHPVPLIVCSSMGTLDPYSIPPLAKILEAKRRAEVALQDLDVPYTIVRPGGLTETPGGAGVLLAPSIPTMGRIARADVATVMIAALGREDVRGKTFEIVNQEGAPAASDPKVFEGLKATS